MPTQNPPLMVSLAPALILAIPMIILNIVTAGRKGASRVLFGILGAVPFVNIISFMYLVSLTDRAVIDALQKIMEKLEK